MSLKSRLAVILGRTTYKILHDIFHRGSSLPGKLAYQFDPQVLKELSRDYQVIIVTGTNGKTLTTSLTTKVLQQKYDHILTNPTGSNMVQGITSAFLAQKKVPKKATRLAVLEVDEANVETICQAMTPSAFVLTNIFRDQMDRYGEIYTTLNKILAGVKLAPQAKLMVNGDAAIFDLQDLPNPKVYYGFQSDDQDADLRANFNVDGVLCPNCQNIIHYHMITYANLGDYFCPHCGFKRPNLDYQVTSINKLTPSTSQFTIDQNDLTINIGGTYNIYNALAAYTVGRELSLNTAQIMRAFAQNEQVFGRQEVIDLDGKQLTIILVKNPVGLNEVLATLKHDSKNYALGFALNANYADGIDTSWIWDGDFEHLPFQKIDRVITGGERWQDINFRFKVAEMPPDKLSHQADLDDFLAELQQQSSPKIYVLATYTAMLQLRKKLTDKGYIKQKTLA
ncbi:Mur ligase family protein [Bombilactobacillus thymidiniphilus]|uniref:Lipid II isoglutaminyl synthase (glutamine-hydrolyzing) subunit MurT n=1 Tax=Bombilactobacillus thymidiniphilus TaxID=2923363 RepID=A0ABY4PDJ0_9LACO|nr:Mur ligase family protein [Bombilactobacillus thymidiniphilus]UQS83853.1 Mur ligase family protein [Bombilactobacillus thymidiniphilus]